jgi:hypothetical protein
MNSFLLTGFSPHTQRDQNHICTERRYTKKRAFDSFFLSSNLIASRVFDIQTSNSTYKM